MKGQIYGKGLPRVRKWKKVGNHCSNNFKFITHSKTNNSLDTYMGWMFGMEGPVIESR
jgi:hypothetical protein